jgi:hypothetical protein
MNHCTVRVERSVVEDVVFTIAKRIIRPILALLGRADGVTLDSYDSIEPKLQSCVRQSFQGNFRQQTDVFPHPSKNQTSKSQKEQFEKNIVDNAMNNNIIRHRQ